MVKGLKIRDIAIVGVIIVISLSAAGYFLFFNDSKKNQDDDEGNPRNKRPVADAGMDIVIFSGEEVFLYADSSYDPDGNDLIYSWDLDAGVDSNSDGDPINDKDIVGMTISTIYPFTEEIITYIVTLNVTDGQLSDTDSVRVTIQPLNTQETPEITMSCRYQASIPYLEAHFILTVTDATSDEWISNYSYRLNDPDGDVLINGSVQELILLAPNATLRFIDSPTVTILGVNDMFYVKEGEDIIEGCMFYLYYGNVREPVGEIELTKS